MDTTGKRSAGDPGLPDNGIPVNRFALFSETILAGVIVLAMSLPVATAPAAYAAGVAHLERHLSGRDDSLRSLWGTFRRALPGSWKAGTTTAAAAVVVLLNLLLATVGQLPGRGLVLPATLVLAAAAAVLLLRTAANWGSAVTWGSALEGNPAVVAKTALEGRAVWAKAYATAKTDALRDWSGSLLLLAGLFMAVVFVWMLPALVIVVPGTLVLAAAAVKIRAATRAAR